MAEEKQVATVDKDAGKLTFQQKGIDLPANVTISVADIKKYIAPKASDSELWMFVNIARSQGLNPFNREIYFVPFKDKKSGEIHHSIVVGFETYLKRVEASGLCEWWTCEKRIAENGKAEWVFATRRKGWTKNVEWVIDPSLYKKEYGPWDFMPDHMGRKVAISQGLRMYYADVISGVPYTANDVEAYLGDDMQIETAATVADIEKPNAEAVFGEMKVKTETPETPPQTIETIVDAVDRKAGATATTVETHDEVVPVHPKERFPAELDATAKRLKEWTMQTPLRGADVEEAMSMASYPVGDDPAGVTHAARDRHYQLAMQKLCGWWAEVGSK